MQGDLGEVLQLTACPSRKTRPQPRRDDLSLYPRRVCQICSRPWPRQGTPTSLAADPKLLRLVEWPRPALTARSTSAREGRLPRCTGLVMNGACVTSHAPTRIGWHPATLVATRSHSPIARCGGQKPRICPHLSTVHVSPTPLLAAFVRS